MLSAYILTQHERIKYVIIHSNGKTYTYRPLAEEEVILINIFLISLATNAFVEMCLIIKRF